MKLMVVKVIVSVEYCGYWGFVGMMNCGRNVEKKRYFFGFVIVMSRLWRKMVCWLGVRVLFFFDGSVRDLVDCKRCRFRYVKYVILIYLMIEN